MTRTSHLTPERAQYLAEVIRLGSEALGEQSPTEIVEEIRQAIEDCPNGLELRIGAHQ